MKQPCSRSRSFAGVVVTAVLALTTVAYAQDQTVTPPPVLDDHALLHKYVWSALGPSGALAAAGASGFDQWRRSPPEWTTDKTGYLQRWASDYAANAIGNTTKYGVARLFHQDPSFTRCSCSGFGPRLRHAVISPFMARTSDGRRVFSGATIAGLAAENVIPASTWYPAPRGARDGVLHTAGGVVAKMGINMMHEFIPYRFHRFHWK